MKKLLFITILFSAFSAFSQDSAVTDLDSVTSVTDNMRFFIVDPNEAIARDRNKNISIYRLDQRWSGGGGDVTKVGTPVNNQIGVWTGDGTIEGDAGFTFAASELTVTDGSNPSTINANGLSITRSNGHIGLFGSTSAGPRAYGSSSTTTAEGLEVTGDIQTGNDSGSTPAILIRSSLNGSSALSVRPIMEISNWTTVVSEVSAAGDWDYQGNNLENFGLSDNPTTTANGSLRFDNGGGSTLEVYDDGTASWLGLTTVTVAAGTYSPTLTEVSNLDSDPTLTSATYSRTGSIVTVYVKCTADPTSATGTEFSITLPVASNFTTDDEAIGLGINTLTGFGTDETIAIESRSATDDVLASFNPGGTANRTVLINFQYEIK